MSNEIPENNQKKIAEEDSILSEDTVFSDILDYHRFLFREYIRKFEDILTKGIFKDSDQKLLANKDFVDKELLEIKTLLSEPLYGEIDEIGRRIGRNVDKSVNTNTRISAERKEGLKKYQNSFIKRIEAQIIRQTEPIFSILKEVSCDSLGISSHILDLVNAMKTELIEFYLQYVTFIDITKESVEYIHETLNDYLKFVDEKFLDLVQNIESSFQSVSQEHAKTAHHLTLSIENIFNHLNTKVDLHRQELEALLNEFKGTSNHFTKELEKVFSHLNSKVDLNKQEIEKLGNDFADVHDIAKRLYNEAVRRSSELFHLNDMRQESVELKHAEILEWMKNLQESYDEGNNKMDKLTEFDCIVKEKFEKIDEILLTQRFLKKKIEELEQKGLDIKISASQGITKDQEGQRVQTPISKLLGDLDYFLFEEKFRGKSEDIKKRQESYIGYFEADGTIIDIGCGKGEFLELLKENGIESYGVDINREMIDHCLGKGLKAIRSDLVEHLNSLSSNSIGGIFSAQTIEHIQAIKVMEFIKLSYDKLKPDGNLIIETINPLSLYSLANHYYKDLFHVQPIHPQTLAFLMEIAGFRNVEIKFISPLDSKGMVAPIGDTYTYPDGIRENVELINKNFSKISDFLYGFQEYFAVGVK